VSCPGLHCPGCSGAQSAAILAAVVVALVVAYESVQWVAERIWWIGGTVAVCLVLSVAASMWLEGRTQRREVAWGRERGIYSRADGVLPYPVRPAVAFRDLHIHLDGVPSAEQAAIVRQAIERAS
jgi:hypothetical protein